jgi:HEAT repeat protein
MSSIRPREPGSGTPTAAGTKKAGRLQTGVRGLIVVVACCGVVSWAARSVWETLHPALVEARRLQSSNPSDRVDAARQMVSLRMDDPGRAIPPLVAALRDTKAEVRIEACSSLGAIGSEAIRSGSAGDAVRGAVAGLIGTMKDREPAVRLAATGALAPIILANGSDKVIDFPAVIAALAAMLGAGDDEIRLAALFALMHCGPRSSADPPAPLAAVLEDRSARIRAMAIRALAAFPRSLDPWLPLLLRRADDGESEVSRACWEAFARSRPPAFSAEAIPRLVAVLGSRTRGAQYYAARALSPHASDPRAAVAIPALLALLREPIDLDRVRLPAIDRNYVNRDPAREAAFVLGKVAPGTESASEVIAALTGVVRADHPSRRASAANALGDFGRPPSQPFRR